MKKLKPAVFIQGDKQYYRDNRFAQNILLKALSQGITNANELRKIAGLRTVADVYRTLDKLAIRKEYHGALTRLGIDLDYIAGGIKTVIDTTDKDAIKLKGLQTLLRSIGLERYEKDDETGKSWEETIITAFKEEDKDGNKALLADEEEDYEVIAPPVPEEEQVKRDEEKKLAEQLYGQ